LTGQFIAMFEGLARPDQPGTFSVIPPHAQPAYYVGRDDSGCAALLIRTTGASSRVPLLLAGIEARFSVACRIEERDREVRTENLTVVSCRSPNREVERYFLTTMEFLASTLGPNPTVAAVAEMVDRMVDLFQRLTKPPKKNIVGLVGELLVIWAAADPAAAVRAWRMDQDERYDFAAGALRIDAKAPTTDRRAHEVSFEQANPPAGTLGVLASFIVQPSGGGFTLSELLSDIEARIQVHDLILKLRTVVADTLGRDIQTALSWSFDLARAISSARVYDVSKIPAIKPPLPEGVSGVRFLVDLSSCRQLGRARIDALASHERALLPS
jgi:hypothetical protein